MRMYFGDPRPRKGGLRFRPFVLMSLALHAVAGALLYWFGSYQVELRRQDQQVAASVRATSQARSARRVADLQKIKEQLEASANRNSQPTPDSMPAPAPAPQSGDPSKLLEQARTLARQIGELDRVLKAEELARLTGMTEEQARAQVDAAATPSDPPKPGGNGAANVVTDPAAEIARLETQARAVLARHDDTLRRDGVAVTAADGPASGEDGLAAALRRPYYPSGAGPGIARKGEFPVADYAAMVKAGGRMLGAGGQYANRIYLNSWYLIGPFPGRAGKGIYNNARHPPEDAVLLDAVYYGKDKRLLRWEYVHHTGYPLIPRDYAEHAIYYGYTEVLMDEERELLAWIGADDDAQVYLNGTQIWKGGNVGKKPFYVALYDVPNTRDRDYNRSEATVPIRLRKGRNQIFFKLANGPRQMFFSMVLTQPGAR